MHSVYHARLPKAKASLFLLAGGIPELAGGLPLFSAQACSPAHIEKHFCAALPGLGPEIAAYAPFSPCDSPLLAAGDVALCGDCSSSLDVAMRLAHEGWLPEWGSVLALRQHAGRGQLRRGWDSPPGNIYAALRLPVSGPFGAWNAALLAGWMLVAAFRELGCPLWLKWPNDLVTPVQDGWGKVGGILLEERGGVLLAGIGINAVSAPPAAALRADAAIPAAVFPWDECAGPFPDVTFRHGNGPARPALDLWAELVKRGRIWYGAQFAEEGAQADFRPAEPFLAWKDQLVLVEDASPRDMSEREASFDGNAASGRLLGLTGDGCLRLSGKSGENTLMSGSVRLLEPLT